MGFIGVDLKKEFEGKFLKFESGVERKLELLSIKQVTKFNKAKTESWPSFEIEAKDIETGDVKTFNPNKSFMQALARIDDQLSVGSAIRVTPIENSFIGKDGGTVSSLKFSISLYQGEM